MRLYSRTHDVSCGIDLHARTMYLCVLDRAGQTLLHRNLPTRPEALLDALAPFRSADLVVGCDGTTQICSLSNGPGVLGQQKTRRPSDREEGTSSKREEECRGGATRRKPNTRPGRHRYRERGTSRNVCSNQGVAKNHAARRSSAHCRPTDLELSGAPWLLPGEAGCCR